MAYRSHLKKRILVQDQGGRDIQTGGILQYFEDLNLAPNAEIGPKDFFEIASSLLQPQALVRGNFIEKGIRPPYTTNRLSPLFYKLFLYGPQ